VAGSGVLAGKNGAAVQPIAACGSDYRFLPARKVTV